jgi:hypothetical protein
MQAGYDGLLRDKTRPSRIPPLGSDIAKRVVALTRTDPPAEATHWTATMMAKAVGISASSVQRSWRAHGRCRGVLRQTCQSPSHHRPFRIAETNNDPKPFTWTADPDKIIAAVRRGHQVLDSIH